MSFVAFMVGHILSIIVSIGYLGIFVLMVIDSACIPMPSEVIMPFAGFASSPAYPGSKFNLYLVTLTGAVGNLVGSWAAYYFGYYVGRAGVLKYGKFFFLGEKHLMIAENWFEKHGDKAVFIGRLLPVVRSFISLPAGIAKMNIWKFSLYSFVGSIPWCFALAYLGYILGENYTLIIEYSSILDYVVIICIVILAIYFFRKFYRERRSGKK